jgi:competence protein ComEC
LKRGVAVTLPEMAALVLSAATAVSLYSRAAPSGRFTFLLTAALFAGLSAIAAYMLKRRRAVPRFALLAALFFLSLIFALSRTAPLPLPFDSRVAVRLRILSDPRVRGSTVQCTARVLQVGSVKYPRFARVVFNIAASGVLLERGAVVRAEGLFMTLPFERSKGYAWYLKSRGVQAVFEGYRGGVILENAPKRYTLFGISNRLKRYIGKVNSGLLLFPQSDFATALLTGNRETIPKAVMESFKRSGTLHILAVSGLHVGFISLFIFFVLRSLRVPTTAIYLAVGCATIFYMIFIGDSPSVRRASLMVLCGTAVFILDRDRDYINLLSIAFIVLWIVNPLVVLNPGFLLSFAATFGILFLVPHIGPLMKRALPSFVASSVAASVGVQVYILPVMLSFFGSFPYINILANIPIVPLAALSLALEICCLLLYPVLLPLAAIIAESNLAVITMILRIAALCARVPPITVNRFPPALIPIYFVVVTVLLLLLFRRIAEEEHEAPG